MTSSNLPTNLPFGALARQVGVDQVVPAPSMLRARDGSVLRWGDADTPRPAAVISPGTPAPIKVAVSPVRPGHAVTVEYRANGGPVRQVIAVPEPRVQNANGHIFRALLPGQPSGLVEFLPVLRFAGQPVSPRLHEWAESPRYEVAHAWVPVTSAGSSAPLRQDENVRRDDGQSRDLMLQRRVLSDGTECSLPIRFFDVQSLLAIFLIDLGRAAELLRGSGLQPVPQEHGMGVVSIPCIEYRKTDIGPYKEVGLMILAAAPGDPTPAYYVTHLPVTTPLADLAGREIWGYNKFVAAIDIHCEGAKFSTTVRDSENATIGALEGRLGSSVPLSPIDTFTFSVLNGRVIKTHIHIPTPSHVSSGDGFVFKVGASNHPMANSLRTLALDGARPVQVQYAHPFQALLFPGRVL
jgi:hypothetical protein